jgi:hypothetical protein
MSAKPATYGAIITDEESAAAPVNHRSFDSSHLAFLPGSTLTRQQRLRKFFLALFPIFVAALFMGGVVYFLLHDFNHLYPAGHNGSVPDARPTTTHHTLPKPTADKFSTNEDDDDRRNTDHSRFKSTSATGGALCSAHSKCASLGLIGNCCPSNSGDILDCC